MKGLSLPHHLGPFFVMHATGILSRIRRSTKPRNRTSHCECLSSVHLNIARSRHIWHHFPDVTVQNSWESVQASPYRPVTEFTAMLKLKPLLSRLVAVRQAGAQKGASMLQQSRTATPFLLQQGTQVPLDVP